MLKINARFYLLMTDTMELHDFKDEDRPNNSTQMVTQENSMLIQGLAPSMVTFAEQFLLLLRNSAQCKVIQPVVANRKLGARKPADAPASREQPISPPRLPLSDGDHLEAGTEAEVAPRLRPHAALDSDLS